MKVIFSWFGDVQLRQKVLGAVLIVAAVFICFKDAGKLEFSFVDDVRYIHSNPFFDPLDFENTSRVWSESYLNLYVPLPLTIWAFQTALFRTEHGNGQVTLNAAVFHWTNVLVHAFAAVGVFLLLRLMFKNSFACILGALVFAVHPMQVESVCWVSGLRDVLSGAFAIYSLYFYLLFDETYRTKKTKFYLASLLCFLMGLFAKATIITVPLIIFALISFRSLKVSKNNLKPLIPFFILALIFGLIAKSLQSGSTLSHVPPPFWTQPLVALDSYFHYLSRIFYPWPLIFDNGHTPQVALASSMLLLRVGAVLIISGLAYYLGYKKKHWVLALALCIGFLGILPISGITPFVFQFISSVGDRYFYVSMLGVSILVAQLSSPENIFGKFSKAIVVMVCLVFTYISMSHVIRWKDTESLFSYNLQHNPKSAFSYNLLGQIARDRGDIQKAIHYFSEGANVAKNAEPATNLGVLLMSLNQVPQAVQAFELAARLSPNDATTHENLGIIYRKIGRTYEARKSLEKAMELDPSRTLSIQKILNQL